MRGILDFTHINTGAKTSVNVNWNHISQAIKHWFKYGFYLHHITARNGSHEYYAGLPTNKDEYIEYILKILKEFADPTPIRFLITLAGEEDKVASTADNIYLSVDKLVDSGYSIIKIHMLTPHKGLYEVNINLNHRNSYYLHVIVSNLIRSAELEFRVN